MSSIACLVAPWWEVATVPPVRSSALRPRTVATATPAVGGKRIQGFGSCVDHASPERAPAP